MNDRDLWRSIIRLLNYGNESEHGADMALFVGEMMRRLESGYPIPSNCVISTGLTRDGLMNLLSLLHAGLA